jgi:hypothetical protein
VCVVEGNGAIAGENKIGSKPDFMVKRAKNWN